MMKAYSRDTVTEALRGSIAKWEAIVAGTGTDQGPTNCPLCVLFWDAPNYCSGCPISEWSGQSYCYGTPYERRNMPGGAQDELDFLKSIIIEHLANQEQGQ